MNSVAIVSQDEKIRKYLEAKVIADIKDMPKEDIEGQAIFENLEDKK